MYNCERNKRKAFPVHAMKVYKESKDFAPFFINLASDALASENNPGTHRAGGWVGTRAGPDVLEKRQSPFPYQDSNLG